MFGTLRDLGFGMSGYHWLSQDITRSAQSARANFRRIHSVDPHPLMNVYALIEHYARIPTLEELAAQSADLSQRIEAAKHKHGMA